MIFLVPFLVCARDNPVAGSDIKDEQVEMLIRQSRYNDASKLINSKLNSTTAENAAKELYYCNTMSFAQLRLRNLDSAIGMARRSLSLIVKVKDSALISDAWRMAAYSYNQTGKLDSALYFTRLLIEFSDRHNDLHQKRNGLVSLATILSQNREYRQALKCYREAELLTGKIRDSLYLPISDYNIGLTYLYLKKHDSCLWYLEKAAKTARPSGRSDILIYIYGTMADCYLALNNEKERKRYLLLANNEAWKIGNKQFLAMGYSNLAQGALEQRNYTEAVEYALKTVELLKEQPYPVLKMKADSMLSAAYEGAGNFQKALKHLKMYIEERETIIGKQQRAQLDELSVMLEVKEKNLTITTQKLEISDKKSKIQLLTLLMIVALLLATGQFIYVVRTRAFRRELFRKERELDQYTEEVNHWMQWKKAHEEISEANENQPDPVRQEVNPANISGTQLLLFSELREIFTRQKLYLDPELNLKTVIKLLGTNKKYLYQAISENSDENFRSFINRYRVDEAKKIMEEQVRSRKEMNLSELYSLAGFNSSVSFYRAFRSVTGLTPKEYLREIQRTVTIR